MGDSWRFRNHIDIFEEDAAEAAGDNRNPEVKKKSSKSREEDNTERHSSKLKRNNDERRKDYHSHKEHKSERRHKKKKSKRSRSKSRDRSRSRDRDRGGREWRRHHDRDRSNYSGSSRARFPGGDKYSQSGRDPRTNFRPVVSSNTSGDSSRNEEIDDRCPSTLLKTIPPEAARLKEEVERRKLLWSKKDKPVEAAAVPAAWSKTAFSDDSDGRVSAKFKRLMGMKDGESSAVGPAPKDNSTAQNSEGDHQRQAEFLANLEKQYEVARATTHTQRGLGLGFSSRILHR